MSTEKPQALVVGGTSGLGRALAIKLMATHKVTVTGRNAKKIPKKIGFIKLDLSATDGNEKLGRRLDWAVRKTISEPLDLVVYAAGFYQNQLLHTLSDADIVNMISVGLLAPAMLMQRIINQHGVLPGFIAVTSTSQWTPRPFEPVYAATKAGLGMLANSLACHGMNTKTLVVGVAGMKSGFWERNDGLPKPHDWESFLDPAWVADQVLGTYHGPDDYRYKLLHVLRNPPRVIVAEKR